MKRIISKLRSYIFGPQWHVKPEHEIKLAFSHKGINYYQVVSGMDLPYERYMAAVDAIQVMEYRLDPQFIEFFFKQHEAFVNAGDMANIARLTKNLYDRSKHITNVQLLYNLASVWFFDETENPYSYNYDYAEEKIRRWRGDSELLGKLLQTPLKNYMPSFDMYNMTLESYFKAQDLEELTTLKYRLSLISKKSGNEEVTQTIKSRISELSK